MTSARPKKHVGGLKARKNQRTQIESGFIGHAKFNKSGQSLRGAPGRQIALFADVGESEIDNNRRVYILLTIGRGVEKWYLVRLIT